MNPSPSVPAPPRPNRHRMVLLTWIGIYPTITGVLWVLLPILTPVLPLPLLTLVVTALVVPTMGYVVMPLLLRIAGRWVMR